MAEKKKLEKETTNMSDIPWMQCERFEDIECFSGELFHTLVFGDCSEEDLSDVSSSDSNEEVSKGSFESASLGGCLS